MVPATAESDAALNTSPPPVRRGVRRRKPKVDPDYVPSAASTRPKQLNKRARRTMAAPQPQQVKLRLRRVKPSIQKARIEHIKSKSEDALLTEQDDKADAEHLDTSTHMAEALQSNPGDVQLCIWQLMAAYCLPPRKRRRHRLEGDLDSFAATQYCHSALSTM